MWTASRNGASGLHRRAPCQSIPWAALPPGPQWSLRLTPEDTCTGSFMVEFLDGPAMEPPAYTGGHQQGRHRHRWGGHPAMEPPAYTGGHDAEPLRGSVLRSPAMEPPAYTGGHQPFVAILLRLGIPAMEPPAYTGGHATGTSTRQPPNPCPQWSLRLTPEDTMVSVLVTQSAGCPAMEPPAYTGGHAPR